MRGWKRRREIIIRGPGDMEGFKNKEVFNSAKGRTVARKKGMERDPLNGASRKVI